MKRVGSVGSGRIGSDSTDVEGRVGSGVLKNPTRPTRPTLETACESRIAAIRSSMQKRFGKRAGLSWYTQDLDDGTRAGGKHQGAGLFDGNELPFPAKQPDGDKP